jgi:tartrate dehydratase beta subunit/fumarate hydratase class I family protein
VCCGQWSFTGTIVTARKAFHHRVTDQASEREKKTTEISLCDSVVMSSWMFAVTIKFDNFFPGVENSGDA